MIYFTSDLHFGHDKDFIYEGRGFSSVQEHDNKLIENWNNIVTQEDEVFILGDIMLNDNIHGLDCIKQLNGKLNIVWGNHDTRNRQICLLDFSREEKPITFLGYANLFKYKKRVFYLSHYPTITENIDENKKPNHQIVINLFGHTHQKEKFYQGNWRMYHVGLDSHEYRPVSIESIIEDMRSSK